MIRFALLIGLALLSPGLAAAQEAAKETPSVTLTGVGTVKAKPDEGYITVGVVTYGQKSAEAVRKNSQTMAALFATLKAKGVKEEGLQTLDFSVSEHYKTVYEKNEDNKREAKQVKDGYVVSNTVHVTVCDLEKFGDVLDAVASGGANSIHAIRFGSSKADAATAEARRLAVAAAVAKGKLLTGGLGVALGRVITINEVSEGRRVQMEAAFAPGRLAASADAVPVSGGSLTYTVHVMVKWELQQPARNGAACGTNR